MSNEAASGVARSGANGLRSQKHGLDRVTLDLVDKSNAEEAHPGPRKCKVLPKNPPKKRKTAERSADSPKRKGHAGPRAWGVASVSIDSAEEPVNKQKKLRARKKKVSVDRTQTYVGL